MNTLLKYLNNYKTALLIVLITGCFFSFWKLGQTDIREWDEARRGVNALEMIERGDYINYYYGGQTDTWNAKPPLAIWAISLSYKMFGYNSFALRFPSALAIVLLLLVCFHLVAIYNGHIQALITCLIILSFKGIIGHHVGRTGDTDAIFVFFLTLSSFFFLLYIDFDKSAGILLSALSLGFAFYTKGFAALFFVPGVFIYTVLKRKTNRLLSDKKTWLGVLIFSSIVFSWFFLNFTYGESFPEATATGDNRLRTMVFYDVFKRLFSSNFEGGDVYGPLYFFPVGELTMGLWSYLFWLFFTYLTVIMTLKKKNLLHFIQSDRYRLFIFSVAFSLPIIFILSIARNIHTWYIAPVLPFFAIMISQGIMHFYHRHKFTILLSFVIIIITLVIRFNAINAPRTQLQSFVNENQAAINKAGEIVLVSNISQSLYLYLSWTGKKINKYTDYDPFKRGSLYIGKESAELFSVGKIQKINCASGYCTGKE